MVAQRSKIAPLFSAESIEYGALNEQPHRINGGALQSTEAN